VRTWWLWRAKASRALRELRSPSDTLLLLRIFLLAVTVPLLLRLKLPTLLALLDAKRAPAQADPARVTKIVRYVDIVLHSGRPVVRRSCLTRGLTLFYFLRRAGLDVSLTLGMGKPNGTVEGHCWLVTEGRPFLENRDPRSVFEEFYRFPPQTGSS
jgi:hypothetical protein